MIRLDGPVTVVCDQCGEIDTYRSLSWLALSRLGARHNHSYERGVNGRAAREALHVLKLAHRRMDEGGYPPAQRKVA